ncbi:nuclear transport factor 2 family protein [Streptomyces sp. NPDC005485]|uniref:nuclear transport factor 2 family protein n=1 Tax=Streptomyces sp. NPDC005485 TaxID=3155591 RepID=UPI0033B55B0A
MSWTRVPLAALVICALLGGSAGCGSSDARERGGAPSASPVGKLLDRTDEQGRHYREVDKKGAPNVAIEVQPDSDDSWDVTLTLHRFRFSPAGTPARAVAGRGIAVLYLDGRTLAELRTAEYHLGAALVPRGTHHVTARLYADDRTVWAVGGKPVESTADITQSQAGETLKAPATPTTPAPTLSDNAPEARTGTGGSPDPGGKAS